MKKLFVTALLATLTLFSVGCATTRDIFGSTPEAQIVTGANGVTAAATLGTTLLKHDKITVTQAKSYRAILGTVDQHLKDAASTLFECRKKTGSNSKSYPDPCKAGIEADIRLAVSLTNEVSATLKKKE